MDKTSAQDLSSAETETISWGNVHVEICTECDCDAFHCRCGDDQ